MKSLHERLEIRFFVSFLATRSKIRIRIRIQANQINADL
jgi:hypothetical protein